ncbi:erythromycin esterase-like protein [Algoriphagus sp. 4150]|nr:erythromycin esterase-like protein [Algoriphagus sp. 4150]
MRSLKGFTYSALDSTESNNARDDQMSDNFLWLKNNIFPKEKIIVWASNSHLFKEYRNLIYPIEEMYPCSDVQNIDQYAM